jgi:hypothetical protein
MIAPRCLIWDHESTCSFLDIFTELENGFVGLATCFVAGPSQSGFTGLRVDGTWRIGTARKALELLRAGLLRIVCAERVGGSNLLPPCGLRLGEP